MNTRAGWLVGCLLLWLGVSAFPGRGEAIAAEADVGRQNGSPLGRTGYRAHYHLEQQGREAKSTVIELTVAGAPAEDVQDKVSQWLQFEARKGSGDRFEVWILSIGYPSETLAEAKKAVHRYVLKEADAQALEFRDRITHVAVLPSLGGWAYLVPRATQGMAREEHGFAKTVDYLGHLYNLESVENGPLPSPPQNARIIELLPDAWIGAASNTRQADSGRHFDNSDYKLIRLEEADYREMAEAGLNCFRVDAQQLPWVEKLNAFYWGLNGSELPYPECLYRSTYLGPTLFLDEPAVCTRDYVIRPRLSKDEAFRKSISTQTVLEAFQTYFRQATDQGAPQVLFNSLKSRADVDLGTMRFDQQNLFSWETMVSTSAYQLSQDPYVPCAMVFEPPGRVGTLRTLPELDMTYGCQIPVDDPKNLIDIIYGFLRGAARLTGKTWGTSIYGAVDRADAFWFLTHAYDLGATRFLFWDNGPGSCVPYRECLALARDLQAHLENFPNRELYRLTHAAEVAILLPAGYNLGHVQLGKGSLWGLGELNLERTNRLGIAYRTVMSNFFIEIERCLRLGVGFDLLWDLPSLELAGYREVVQVREDGKVEVRGANGTQVLGGARSPVRPDGQAPGLKVELDVERGNAPLQVRARAEVTETSAPVYYTHGTDREGIYRNAYVAWEVFGPNEDDYRTLIPQSVKDNVGSQHKQAEVTTEFALKTAGSYRVRVATVDLTGRSTVVWKTIVVY